MSSLNKYYLDTQSYVKKIIAKLEETTNLPLNTILKLASNSIHACFLDIDCLT